MEEYKTVAFSTSLMTEKDSGVLRNMSYQGTTVMCREYGFFIKLCVDDHESNIEDEYSVDLVMIIRWALWNGYQMIEFDRDVPVDEKDGFKEFDW